MSPQPRKPTNGRDLEGTVEYRPPIPSDSRTVPQLLRELADEGADLVREEVALAKTEMSEKLEAYRGATLLMALGGGLLAAALLTLLWAVNLGLTSLLTPMVGLDIAVWLSPLILTVLVGGIGAALLAAGRTRIRKESLTPERTKATLEENARWVRSKAREMRLEAENG